MRNCFESFAKSTGGFGQIHRWILQNARVDFAECTCGFSRMHVWIFPDARMWLVYKTSPCPAGHSAKERWAGVAHRLQA